MPLISVGNIGEISNGIGAATNIQFTITNPKVWYDGREVTSVPTGKAFKVTVDFNCVADTSFTQVGFRAGISMTDGASIKAFNSQSNAIFTNTSSGTMPLDSGNGTVIMPDHDVVLTLQPWFSNLRGDTSTPDF